MLGCSIQNLYFCKNSQILKMRRKYLNTIGYYVYAHITPDQKVYYGISKQQPSERWNSSTYKTSSLYPYIEKFG